MYAGGTGPVPYAISLTLIFPGFYTSNFSFFFTSFLLPLPLCVCYWVKRIIILTDVSQFVPVALKLLFS